MPFFRIPYIRTHFCTDSTPIFVPYNSVHFFYNSVNSVIPYIVAALELEEKRPQKQPFKFQGGGEIMDLHFIYPWPPTYVDTITSYVK